MILIFFIICIILILIFLNYDNIQIIFLNSYQLSNFLQLDLDNFYSNLSNENLKLRNINNKNQYLLNIEKELYTFTEKEKLLLSKAIKIANKKLKSIKFPEFNYKKLYKYPWIIGCSKTNNYEFGYPHTRNNIIILNIDNIYDNNLYKTLIHERIHIYQKLYPNDINKFLNTYNIIKSRKKNNYDRANPDTDNYVYKYKNINFECIIDNTLNIKCTNNDNIFEHPFEYMAYKIVNSIN
jgi:hypothetical protein